jgi:hypothetical protein
MERPQPGQNAAASGISAEHWGQETGIRFEPAAAAHLSGALHCTATAQLVAQNVLSVREERNAAEQARIDSRIDAKWDEE